MGIETGALLTALGTAATTAAVGAVATKLLTPKAQTQQKVTPVTEADKPQDAKQADLNAIKNKNALAAAASGQLAGNNSTLLTGSTGVDASGLNLGTNTLLGS